MDFSTSATKRQLEFSVALHVLLISARAKLQTERNNAPRSTMNGCIYPMAAKLTVLIPCKNERRNIRLCIESVADLADELLIADSGSVDGTMEIVKSVEGCRLIEREYRNSANFKNWAIPQASFDWILLLDADERITPELTSEIRAVLAQPRDDIDGYSIARLNHFLGHRIKRCGWDTDRVIRLFRRDACRYRERWVHAEIDLEESRVANLREPMLHYTTWTTDQYVEKLNRYAGWGALNAMNESKNAKAPSLASLAFIAPLRFLQLYLLRRGFLDGVAGFQVCMYAAFYSFLKKSKLWELHHAAPQPDPEATGCAASAPEPRSSESTDRCEAA